MCVKLVIYKDYAEMHGQENKIYDHIKNNFDLVSSLISYGFVVKFKYLCYFVLVVFW